MTTLSTLTIIPAKSRSRRVPGKNMRLLAGRPLMVHAVEQAQGAGVCGVIHVATDDEAIARAAREAGADVPFLRVNDFDDMTSAGQVAVNALRRYRDELGKTFDLVCLLLPTSPLRAPEDIRACRETLLGDDSLDAAGSFVEAAKHPAWAWTPGPDGVLVSMDPGYCDLEREELPRAYHYDGAVYWAKADFFDRMDGNQYRGRIGLYAIAPERAVDVDTPLDFAFAEFLMSRGGDK